ncbi:MAG: hypothetical protein ACLR6J_19875 [Parabacteroides merdae]
MEGGESTVANDRRRLSFRPDSVRYKPFPYPHGLTDIRDTYPSHQYGVDGLPLRLLVS